MTKAEAIVSLCVSLTTVAISQILLKARLMGVPVAEQAQAAMVWRVLCDPLVWLAITLVLVGAVCWYVAMVHLPLSFMLPTAGSIAPVVSIGAYVFLGELLTFQKLAAISVIAIGVAWLGWLNA